MTIVVPIPTLWQVLATILYFVVGLLCAGIYWYLVQEECSIGRAFGYASSPPSNLWTGLWLFCWPVLGAGMIGLFLVGYLIGRR